MAPLVTPLGPAHSPVAALAGFDELPGIALLHSAAPGHPLNRYSFLSADPVASIAARADEWPQVRDRIRASCNGSRAGILQAPFQGGWIGWFGYELGTAFDATIRHDNQAIAAPDIALGLHDWVIVWDHASGEQWLVSTGVNDAGQSDPGRARVRADAVTKRWHSLSTRHTEIVTSATINPPLAVSDFSQAAYEAAVARAVDYVLDGDIFQVNIAQRFTAPFSRDSVALYQQLTELSPAPMAAFIRRGDISIISASPEQFLKLDAGTRIVETKPIKGTRPRHPDPVRDASLATELLQSDKDRAENVMIVDLLRNDLSRVCRPRTVRAAALCALESHPTVHHLVSHVVGELRPECDALDLLAVAFPGGSISGAPKLRAMEIIGELEPIARGVYSGAIGWVGLDGSLDSSIAIRTITVADGVASFHAGGGITSLSEPAAEYRETLDKAQAMLSALERTA